MIPQMDFTLMVPELALIGAGILVLLADAFWPRKHPDHDPRSVTLGLTLLGIVVAIGWIELRLWPLERSMETFEGLFLIDRFALAFKLVVLFSTGLCALLCDTWLKNQRIQTGAFMALVLFASSGMLYLVSATDMVMLFVALELMSIPMYCLAASLRWDDRSVEAGVKYLVLGSFATAIMLMGFAFLYAFGAVYTGEATTRIGDIAAAAIQASAAGDLPGYAYLGGLLALVGLLFKISAVPFHMWTPDVYEGAPTAITAWMSVVVKTVTAAVLLRFFGPALLDALGLQPILWAVAALTMFLGNTLALTQDNVKRMLAYSSVAHGGYMLVGVLAGSSAGAAAVLWYAGAYAVATIAAFAVLVFLSREGHEVETFEDLRGLGTQHVWLGAVMAISMLSLLGIPPLAGFFGKFAIFRAAVSEGYVVLTVIGVLTSAVSVAYYLRPIVVMFMLDRHDAAPSIAGRAWSVKLALGIAAIATVLLGLMPSASLDLALESVRALAGAF